MLTTCQVRLTCSSLTRGQVITSLGQAPDADILREIIELLRARVATGAVTFLIKVKAHQREPLKNRSDGVPWQWEEEKSTRRSVWTAGVKKAVMFDFEKYCMST